jgi:hypothetical protein
MTHVILHITDAYFGPNRDLNWKHLKATTINVRDYIRSLPSKSENDFRTSDFFIYESVRIVSLINCRAIISKLPFSIACRPEDRKHLSKTINRVPLSRWRQISGIWSWILLTINPQARDLQEGVHLRYLMRFCATSHALREWQSLVNISESFLAIQRFIRESGESIADSII